MCMYTEQEFRSVRAERVQDRDELRVAIDQLRRVIDRIRQKMVQPDLRWDGRAAGQGPMSASPEFREVTVTAAEQDLYSQLMYVQVAIREDRRELRAAIQELRRATELLRQQMPVTATATTTTTTTTTAAGASTTPPDDPPPPP